jgi:hypothetical protein
MKAEQLPLFRIDICPIEVFGALRLANTIRLNRQVHIP